MTLIERMQELLEAERAGFLLYEQMAFLTLSKDAGRFFMSIRNGEGAHCEMIHSLLAQRQVAASNGTGGFMEKVLALDDEKERIALIIKGQAWVVRKIQELPEEELTSDEKIFFQNMMDGHIQNIRMCREFLSRGE